MKDSPIIELCKEDYKKLWEFLTPATEGQVYRNPTCDRANFMFLGATFVWRNE